MFARYQPKKQEYILSKHFTNHRKATTCYYTSHWHNVNNKIRLPSLVAARRLSSIYYYYDY